MAKKMLIDSTHPEETRVVVVNGNKVEEFDFDSTSRSLITGNIYLAKVSRIEPSLQAAFVDYGGNRQGFLAFSEIHPDYYQIPQADREALMQEEIARQEEEAQEEEAEDIREEEEVKRPKSRRSRRSSRAKNMAQSQAEEASVKSDIIANEEADVTEVVEVSEADTQRDDEGIEAVAPEVAEEKPKSRRGRRSKKPAASIESADDAATDKNAAEGDVENIALEALEEAEAKPAKKRASRSKSSRTKVKDLDEASENAGEGEKTIAFDADEEQLAVTEEEPVLAEEVETEAADVEDEIQPKRPKKRAQRSYHRYKIQEVIKPRQILLVQVTKEERGNKGAALTTYISLPGRYCVLMPNTARGGGISRKIGNINDRKRLRSLAKGFNVPKGAGLIIRTAGAKKDAEEIERDYAFLTRQWNQIRELTLSSTAPAAVYEESGPIKRAIRDLLTNETDEILVEGERGYEEAREYVDVLIPERVKSVKLYNDKMPLFSRYKVEGYLNSMFNPVVQLKSGGYLVIGVTEALVAIDVNSGRSTKEASIEDTALKTNLEAAEEVARQLKLRDLAGLIVIDFIDMEQNRHQQEVENRLKDCLRKDRARIQVGRISSFGLLEMSRQRLRTGLVEAITTPCPHCQGTGILRSDDSIALSVIRAIEEEIARGRANEIEASVSADIANFLFNEKRDHIFGFMEQYGVLVRIKADPSLHSNEFNIQKIKNPTRPMPKSKPVSASSVMENKPEDANGDEKPANKRRRRRGGRGRKKDDGNSAEVISSDETVEAAEDQKSEDTAPKNAASEEEKPKRKSRSRKIAEAVSTVSADDAQKAEKGTQKSESAKDVEKPKRKRRTKAEIEADKIEAEASGEKTSEKTAKKAAKKAAKSAPITKKNGEDASETAAKADESADKPKRKRRTKAEIEAEKAQKAETEAVLVVSSPESAAKPAKKKTGWWSV